VSEFSPFIVKAGKRISERSATSVERAYGALWNYRGTDSRVHEARRLILETLTRDQQMRGIAHEQRAAGIHEGEGK
jgi:hypothetical protein